MKKRFLFLLAITLFAMISFASANIFINDDFQDYNLGDNIRLEGYIDSNSDVRNVFRGYLDCEDSAQLFAKMADVKAGKRYFYDEDAILPFGYKGECSIRVTFDGQSISSSDFTITDELKGNLFVRSKSLKLGDNLEISGDASYQDNDDFNGVGIVSLNKNGEGYFVDTFNIENGEIDYSTVLESLPPETYSLSLEVFDFYGNTKIFDAEDIIVSDDISVKSDLYKTDYLPGEEISISGIVEDATGDYKLSLSFDGKIYEQSFESRNFDYSLKTSDDIKSGLHEILIKISDSFGNYYERKIEINIIGVPKRLDVKVDNAEGYFPEDSVKISVFEYDQGDDLYPDTINVRVLDPKNNEILNTDLSSGSIYGLDLEKYARPGEYKLTAKSTNFEEQITLNVNEVEKIDAYYDENRLKISNVGNVDIDDVVMVTIGEDILNFNINLKPSEIESFDLRSYIEKDGYYELTVNFLEDSFKVDSYISDDRSALDKFTGNVVGGGNTTYGWVVYVLVLIIILLVIYLIFSRNPGKNKIRYERDVGFREAQEKIKKINARKNEKKPKRRLFNAKEITEEDARDFRESMVSKMKER